MQKQEGEWEHSSLTSSGNAAACSLLRAVGGVSALQFKVGRGVEEIRPSFVSLQTLLKLDVCRKAQEVYPRLNCQSSAQYTGALVAVPPLGGFTSKFCFQLPADTANHLFMERNYQSSFDSTMIAQSFMVFLLKVDARLNITKVSLFGHNGKTSWVSLGLLMALNSFLTMNRGQVSDKNSSHLGELQLWCVVQMGRQAVTAETCLT